jgi:hypothetical protein
MSDLITIYSTPDFWFFNKESAALAIALAPPTGLLFAIGHEAGKALWFWVKRKLGK